MVKIQCPDLSWLVLLREAVPKATTIAFLVNSSHPNAASDIKDVQAAAAALAWRLEVVTAARRTDRIRISRRNKSWLATAALGHQETKKHVRVGGSFSNRPLGSSTF
jgi:hypothetical protein